MIVLDFQVVQGAVLGVDTTALATSTSFPASILAIPLVNLQLSTTAPITQIWPGDFPWTTTPQSSTMAAQVSHQLETAPGDVPWPKPTQ